MKALKALVIFMGILIAIGVTVIGVTVYRRATDMTAGGKATPPSTSGQTGVVQAGAGVAPQAGGTSQPGLADQGGASGALTLSSAAPQSFGSRDLGLPAGSEILSVQTVSLQPGVERVLVFARLPDGGSRILVLDPLRGNIGGEWRVPGAPNAGAAPPP